MRFESLGSCRAMPWIPYGCLHCTIGKAECVTPLADFLPSRGRVKVKASSATQVAPPSALRHECGPQNPATASAATGI